MKRGRLKLTYKQTRTEIVELDVFDDGTPMRVCEAMNAAIMNSGVMQCMNVDPESLRFTLEIED